MEEKIGKVESKVGEAKEAKAKREKELEQELDNLGALEAQIEEKSKLVKESRRSVSLRALFCSTRTFLYLFLLKVALATRMGKLTKSVRRWS